MVKRTVRVWALLFVLGIGITTLGLSKPAHAIAGEVIYTGTNTGLSGDDDDTQIPIGFNFDYYGTTYSDVWVNINGTLGFDTNSAQYSNTPIPTSDIGQAVMPFWDDIITRDFNDQSIYYRVIGTAPHREFIVQWTNMYFYSDPTAPMGTFQAILYEGTNKIQFQYRDLLGGDASKGASATVGITKDDTTGIQALNETPDLTQGQAISYVPSGGTYTQNLNATYDLVYLSDAAAPAPTTLSAPANAATAVDTTPTFTWQAAALADSYQLIVATDAGFSNVVINETGITDTHFTPVTDLDANTQYYWKVGAVNNVSSSLSDTWSFTTAPADDHDGISAGVEAAAPNGGDANNDGTADNQQANVSSLVDPIDNHYVTVAVSGCTTGNTAVTAAAPAVADAGFTYPAGLVSFSAGCSSPGGTATVSQYYYGVNPAGLEVRKYNANSHTYEVVPGATVTSVTIGGQSAALVVYSLTDGGPLDQDGSANGTIVDPVGVALAATTTVAAPNTGLMPHSTWPGALALGAGITSLGAFARRPRRRPQDNA